MSTGVYKLAKASGGCSHYAEITVETSPGEARVSLSPEVFSWLEDVHGPDAWEWAVCDSFREAAAAGCRYALTNLGADVDTQFAVTVQKIHATVADTSWDSVAYAACLATWKALGAEGSQPPYWEGRRVVFPAGIEDRKL